MSYRWNEPPNQRVFGTESDDNSECNTRHEHCRKHNNNNNNNNNPNTANALESICRSILQGRRFHLLRIFGRGLCDSSELFALDRKARTNSNSNNTNNNSNNNSTKNTNERRQQQR